VQIASFDRLAKSCRLIRNGAKSTRPVRLTVNQRCPGACWDEGIMRRALFFGQRHES
jgi:hypothetical protein